jgi:hypothetical protein
VRVLSGLRDIEQVVVIERACQRFCVRAVSHAADLV